MLYKCHKCGKESDTYELQDSLTLGVRDDLVSGEITVQIECECAYCGEYTMEYTVDIALFRLFE